VASRVRTSAALTARDPTSEVQISEVQISVARISGARISGARISRGQAVAVWPNPARPSAVSANVARASQVLDSRVRNRGLPVRWVPASPVSDRRDPASQVRAIRPRARRAQHPAPATTAPAREAPATTQARWAQARRAQRR
jgi:hypothetical protein